MAQGTTLGTRVGNTISCQYVELRGDIMNGDTTAKIPHTVRIMVYIYRNPHGSQPTVADLLDISGDKNVTVTGIRNLDMRNQFTVLLDKEIVVAASDQSGSKCPFHFFLPIKCRTLFSTNDGDFGDIESNSVWISAFTDTDVATDTNNVLWMCQARLRFYDN